MQLDPALIAQIQAAIASGQLQLGGTGRSPLRDRQLHDLTLLPTADDPRPTFFWSAEKPRNEQIGPGTPYPRLLWTAEGVEVTVHTADEHKNLNAQGYLDQCPADVVINLMDELQMQFEALPEEDRNLLIAAQKRDRIAKLQAQFAELPEDKLNALLAQVQPEKRGPGRPRKDVA